MRGADMRAVLVILTALAILALTLIAVHTR
jgi:hypothetical protein